jgi:transposase
MLSLSSNTRIYLHLPPTDLRKSFDGLGGLVRSAFQADLMEGGWFLFLNKRRDRLKILYWDRDGEALWYKRLQGGVFEKFPALAEDAPSREIDATELALLLSGVRLDAPRRRRFTRAG